MAMLEVIKFQYFRDCNVQVELFWIKIFCLVFCNHDASCGTENYTQVSPPLYLILVPCSIGMTNKSN